MASGSGSDGGCPGRRRPAAGEPLGGEPLGSEPAAGEPLAGEPVAGAIGSSVVIGIVAVNGVVVAFALTTVASMGVFAELSLDVAVVAPTTTGESAPEPVAG